MSMQISISNSIGGIAGAQVGGTPTPPPFSNVNSFSFDGVDDSFIGVGTYSELDGQSKATFSAWIKADSLSSQSYLFAIGGSATVFQVAARFQSISATNARIWFYIGDASNSARSYANLGSIKNDGQWHHLMICMDLVTFSSFDEVDFFLDGNLLTTNGYYNPTSLVNSATSLAIGNRETPNTGLMVGNIDEFAIWSGTDLRNDVATIYNNGEPTDLNNNGLTAPTTWQRFGDNGAVWNGATWTMTDVNGGYTNRSINMVEANRTTDVPTASTFSNTKSIALDGVDDTINVGATPLNLRFNRLDTFSFSAWVKREGTNNQVILSNQLAPSTNYRGYYFAIDSNEKLIVVFRSTLSDSLVFRGNLALDLNWNHVAFTYDGTASTSSGQFYINGVADTTTGTGTLTGTAESTDVLYLGCRNNTDNFFDGKIDEVAIFNTELSASDVTSIYNGGVPNDISSLSPLSWWRCGDGDTAPTLTDNGSGGNDGTMTNFTTFSTDVPT